MVSPLAERLRVRNKLRTHAEGSDLLQHAHNPVNWYARGDEVCEQKVCALPTSDPGVLARQLAKVHPLATP
jgi:uncharacterized protein YyaL (SSP411 family)